VSTANDPWGRVADDGTVYVSAGGSERVVGSWQAGSPDEALAFYRRKYESLETEVALLEQRIAATDLSPGSARATIDRLLEAVATANAVGDLDSLHGRLEALTGLVEHRREEHKDRHRSEFFYGELARTVTLPKGVDEGALTASYRDGILEVRVPLPKQDEATAAGTKIPVARAD